MRHYRLNEDLDLVLSQEKPEPVIRLFWLDYKKGEAYRKFVDELINGTYDEQGKYIPSKYEVEYPETDENNNPIEYVEYSEVERKINPESYEEEIIPILPKECYEFKESENKFGEKVTERVIKEDCKHRPTKELYLELHEEEFIEPTDEELLEEYLEFIKPILENRIQKLSDNKLKEIKKSLAGRDITLEQEERYKVKYEKALEARNSSDYSEFELEASITGKTPEELVELIIKLGELWNDKINKYSIIIDSIRVGLKNEVLYADSFEKLDIINQKIKNLEKLKSTDTFDDYINILQ